MERVGILVVSYGARACSIIDALSRSTNYRPEFYVADRQRNPFNAKRAKEHAVIPNLNVHEIASFAEKHKSEIDFGIVGPENPIIDGVRDVVESKTGIPMICPTKEFAIEGSKVRQRELLQEACPEVNPRFRVFGKNSYSNLDDAKKDVFEWLDTLHDRVAVKPDKPGFGKGVGVWGDHFTTREELWTHFLSIYETSPVIIEEKIEGEEFSLQFLSDGRTLVPTPAVRDYKRAFDDDRGPNTGGMGSYKDTGNLLPFMSRKDWDDALDIGGRVFAKLRAGANAGLRGVWYFAFVCTKDGLKIFEINTRFGMPEAQCIMPVIAGDFVDVCFSMIDGSLKPVNFEEKATVVIYKVPPTYGGKEKEFAGTQEVELSIAEKLSEKHHGNLRIYPCSMELREGKTYALGSRTVCSAGIGDSINEARRISIEGVHAIHGNLWSRMDIASEEHIQKSIENMRRLRGSIV